MLNREYGIRVENLGFCYVIRGTKCTSRRGNEKRSCLACCDVCLMDTAYFNDIIVGAVCSREEKLEGQKRLYIMTLGCLAPYRRLGIGLCPHRTTVLFT